MQGKVLFSVKRVSWIQLFQSLSVGLAREPEGEGKEREVFYTVCSTCGPWTATPASLVSLLETQSPAQPRAPGPEPAFAQDLRAIPVHIEGSKAPP